MFTLEHTHTQSRTDHRDQIDRHTESYTHTHTHQVPIFHFEFYPNILQQQQKKNSNKIQTKWPNVYSVNSNLQIKFDHLALIFVYH